MDEDVQALLENHRYRQAFERLVELYEVKVFRMAVMFLRDANRAEDVAQDIFLKLWQALPAYDGRAAPSTWLYAIARNTCLTALRSEALRKTSPLDSIGEPVAARDVWRQQRLEQHRTGAMPGTATADTAGSDHIVLPAGEEC